MSVQNPVFIPDFINVFEDLRRACDMPTPDHRSPFFGETLHPALKGVAEVVGTAAGEVFVFPAIGTAGSEVAPSNTFSPGAGVLATRNGMFSHRWIDVCRRHGRDVRVIERDRGQGAGAVQVETVLRADVGGRIRAMLATHNDTATGVVSAIGALRGARDSAGHDALLFLNGVSSIGPMPFRFDEWKVDVAITGSQKEFILPPGLAIAVSLLGRGGGRSRDRAHAAHFPRRRRHAGGIRAWGLSLHFARESSERLQPLARAAAREGMKTVWARHHHIAEGVRAAVRGWGLKLCADGRSSAPTA